MKNFVMGALAMTMAWAAPAMAQDAKSICVYDPAGKAGPIFKIASGFESAMEKEFSTAIDVVAYTDEKVATEDYVAGKCDGVVATGVRLQRFNRFPTTIEAVGAIPDYKMMKKAIFTINKYAANALVSGEHETAGILPLGAVYLFVNDRNIDTVPELASKKIATLGYDKASKAMVGTVGAVMVEADLGSLGPKFNNGTVDACYVSAVGYDAFELHKGLGANGGIVKYPLAMSSMQMVIRKSSFPDGFGAKSREYLYGQFDTAVSSVKEAEAKIPAKYWINIDDQTRMDGWADMFQTARVKLRDEVKAYNGSMLSMLRQLRCTEDGTRSECAEKVE